MSDWQPVRTAPEQVWVQVRLAEGIEAKAYARMANGSRIWTFEPESPGVGLVVAWRPLPTE